MGLCDDNHGAIQRERAMSRDWTYPSELADHLMELDRDYGEPTNSINNRGNSVKDTYSIIREDWEKGFAACIENGILDCELADSTLFIYVTEPEQYEKDMAEVYDRLPSADQAWLTNTYELVQKYHALYKLAEEKEYIREKSVRIAVWEKAGEEVLA